MCAQNVRSPSHTIISISLARFAARMHFHTFVRVRVVSVCAVHIKSPLVDHCLRFGVRSTPNPRRNRPDGANVQRPKRSKLLRINS